MNERARQELTSTGALRVGINLGNTLLVSDRAQNGTPVGVAPDFAKAIADALDVAVSYTSFDRVGDVADAITAGTVDIGLIAIEEERAKTISFSPHYCEIEATYLVPANSAIQAIEDVDRPGVRIAVSNRAAYDLYLSRTLKHAELVRAQGLQAAAEMFVHEKLDALAGLRLALLENAQTIPEMHVLESKYTTVEQAIGTQPKNEAATEFLVGFVSTAKKSGLITKLIERHGQTGRLMVAG